MTRGDRLASERTRVIVRWDLRLSTVIALLSPPMTRKINSISIGGRGMAEIQARGLVYETIDPEELERIGLTRGLKGDAELRT